MSFSVILPTLNEKGHILKLIDDISVIFEKRKLKFEILVVDDNSTDGTIEKVKNHALKKGFLSLILRESKKKNLAASINDGIKASKFENIIWMDADFQHPPEYLEKFIKYSSDNDAVIASRFLKNSKRYFNSGELEKEINENQSYIYNRICKKILFDDVTDYTSGFICVKKKIFQNYKLKGFYGDYFVSLIVKLKKNKNKILEIPFEDAKRASGLSKTVVNINFKYIYTCVRYILTLLYSYIKYKIGKR